MYTYTNVLAFHKELRYFYRFRVHSLLYLLLILDAHEDVPFFEFHKQRTQYLLDIRAFGICVTYDAHTRCIKHHLTGILFLEVL